MMATTAGTVQKTLYDLLETRADAGREEIEQAYRRAVARLQPEIDAGRPDALNQLRLLREAYHILTDAKRRARYDAWIKPLTGDLRAQLVAERRADGLAWTIAVTLAVVAIGLMLTVFMLLDRAGDMHTDYAEIVRQKKAGEHNQPQEMVVPRPAPAGGGKNKDK